MIFLVFIGVFILLTLFDFFRYLFSGKRGIGESGWLLDILVMFILYFMLVTNFGLFEELDCCNELGPIYSPEHRLTIHFWILISFASLIYSNLRSSLLPPLAEFLLNGILLTAIILNLITWIHIGILGLVGHLLAILIFAFSFLKNYNLIHNDVNGENAFKKIVWKELTLREMPFILFSFLAVLPLKIASTLLLLLFGQRPDSIIRVFTDTYHYNLSEWTHLCDNVQCGGHYLCSIAANGHKGIVKPIRLGVRHEGLIICNRQLLVANAFEEFLEIKFSKTHSIIRRNYDAVGDLVHKYYYLFRIKWISDLTYILMKPLELFFLVFLYLFDKKPEDRIAIQYIRNKEMVRRFLCDTR